MTRNQLLTETAYYDEPGSWGRASKGWPEIRGDEAYAMYVFANQCDVIPYGSYVLMSHYGEYDAKESCIRVQAEFIKTLKREFKAAGKPSADESVSRRVKSGKSHAPKWW